jgi:hypothetical protein
MFIVAGYLQKFASQLRILRKFRDESALRCGMFGHDGEYFFLQPQIARHFSECLTAQLRLACNGQSDPADLRWIFEGDDVKAHA